MDQRPISHRGNVAGRVVNRENRLEYLESARAAGFQVEVDVWWHEGELWLGHDGPSEPIELFWLAQPDIWVHAKNVEALCRLLNYAHVFFHDQDAVALTSCGLVWTRTGAQLTQRSIAVLPEQANYTPDELRGCYAICSDYPARYIGATS
jgi:hypothetical protein